MFGLVEIAAQAICACSGEVLCRRVAAGLPDGPYHLVGAGKAAVSMARGVMDALGPPEGGLLVSKDGHGRGFGDVGVRVRLRHAGHPVPDARSAEAGEALLAYLRAVPGSSRVVALISGGASALLASPLAGLAPAELAASTQALLASGLAIDELNLVRRHLTCASAGRLAQACAAQVDVLVLSDVLSGRLEAIGSGPFAPDEGTFADALEVARAVAGMAPAALRLLARGARGKLPDTPGADAPCFARVRHQLVGSHHTLRAAAIQAAVGAGFGVRVLAPSSGDVQQAAGTLAAASGEMASGELLLGGGEPTVELPPEPGRGGRNQQLALLMARALDGGPPRAFLALGSDGTDGPTDAAGAGVDETSWVALRGHGDPARALARADAHPLLDAAGALVRTGATGTNLLDLHLLAAGRGRGAR